MDSRAIGRSLRANCGRKIEIPEVFGGLSRVLLKLRPGDGLCRFDVMPCRMSEGLLGLAGIDYLDLEDVIRFAFRHCGFVPLFLLPSYLFWGRKQKFGVLSTPQIECIYA